MKNILNPGDKVKFKEEKQRYTVQGVVDHYAICTKPFNPKRTTLYSIIDFKRNVRGRDNMYGHGYETQEHIHDALKLLKTGEMEVSYRNYIDLNIERIDRHEPRFID